MTSCLGWLGTIISHWVSFRDLRHSVRPKLLLVIQFHLISLWLSLTLLHMGVGPVTAEKVTSPTDTQQSKGFVCISPSVLKYQTFITNETLNYCPFNDMRTKRMLNISKSSIQKTILWPFSLYVGKMKKTQVEIVASLSSESRAMNWTKQREIKEDAERWTKNNCEFRVEGVNAGYENSNACFKDGRSGREFGSRRSKYSDPSLLKCLTSAICFLKSWQITHAKDKRWNYSLNLCMFSKYIVFKVLQGTKTCWENCKTSKPLASTI